MEIALFIIIIHLIIYSSAALHPNDYWTESNNGIVSWNVRSIAVDHQNSSIIYALTQANGVYKSVDGGETWNPKTNGIPADPSVTWGHLFGNQLTMDPSNSSILYTNFGGMPFRTADGGESWQNITEGIDTCLPQHAIAGVAVDPQNSSHIFAAFTVSSCPGGIYESDDSGATWTHIASYSGSGDLNNDAWALTVDPTNSSRLYSAPQYLGFLYSTDGGHHWTRNSPTGATLIPGMEVEVHPENTSRIILGQDTGLYVSQDHGISWTDKTDVMGGAVYDIDFAPSDPSIGYAVGMGGIAKSTDGGLSWSKMNDDESLSLRSVAIDPDDPERIYLADLGKGVFMSTNSGEDIEQKNSGLPISRDIRATAIAPSDPTIYYISVIGNGFYRSEDKGESWTLMSVHGDVINTIDIEVDNNDPEIVFAGITNIYKSTDGGITWNETLESGDDTITDIQMDPNDNSIIFATSSRWPSSSLIYKSEDNGDTWGTKTGFSLVTRSVTPIVIDESNSSRIYVGTYNGLRRSMDGGETWSLITNGLTGYGTWIDGIGIYPENPSRLYLTARDHNLHYSDDYGSSWATKTNTASYPGRIIIDWHNPDDFYVFTLYSWMKFLANASSKIYMPTTGIKGDAKRFRESALQDPLNPNRFISGDFNQGFMVYNRYEDRKVSYMLPKRVIQNHTLYISGTVEDKLDGDVDLMVNDSGTILLNKTVPAENGHFEYQFLVNASIPIGQKKITFYFHNLSAGADGYNEAYFTVDDLNIPTNHMPQTSGFNMSYDYTLDWVRAGDFNYYDEDDDEETGSIKDIYINNAFLKSESSSQTALIHFDGSPNTTENDPYDYNVDGEFDYATGKFGQAIHFGNYSWVNYDSRDVMDLHQGTIEFWVNTDWDWDNLTEDVWFIWFSGYYGDYIYLLCNATTDTLDYILYSNSTKSNISIDTSDWTKDEWHHIAITYNLSGSHENNSMEIFADERYSSESGIYPIRTIGLYDAIGFGHHHYSMDELRISDAVLDPTVINYSRHRDTTFYDDEILVDNSHYGGLDNITLKYCPYDGTMYGECLNRTVLINQPPIAESILLNPETVLPDGTLTCYGAASDPEGQPMTYYYQFYINSIGQGWSLSSQFDCDGVCNELDDIYCEFYANDNEWNTSILQSNNATVVSDSDGDTGGDTGGGSPLALKGGGGGAYYAAEAATNETCTEDWSCGEWSECMEGIRIRECFDTNDCKTSVNIPATQTACEGEPPIFIEKAKGTTEEFETIMGLKEINYHNLIMWTASMATSALIIIFIILAHARPPKNKIDEIKKEMEEFGIKSAK
ncbi:hypothetical protein JW968_00780 [Candidatus Woesearchaeota archaeon]|nr:hypothetical protein [Candidatus Woesearchaeota archaeon]